MPSRMADEADDQARNEEAGLSAGAAAMRDLGTACAACFTTMSLVANDASAGHLQDTIYFRVGSDNVGPPPWPPFAVASLDLLANLLFLASEARRARNNTDDGKTIFQALPVREHNNDGIGVSERRYRTRGHEAAATPSTHRHTMTTNVGRIDEGDMAELSREAVENLKRREYSDGTMARYVPI